MHYPSAFARRTQRLHEGVTLLECLIAGAILSAAVLGFMLTAVAGHKHLLSADAHLRATRLAEHLMEEIRSRPLTGGGGNRPMWSVDGFNGFYEEAGSLRDFLGALYPAPDQAFARRASVTVDTQTVVGLSAAQPGLSVVVTIAGPGGEQWSLSRFIPEEAP